MRNIMFLLAVTGLLPATGAGEPARDAGGGGMTPHVITWPAPAGESASPDFTVEVDGQPVFVYQARVRAEILQKPGIWSHVHNGPAERASFAIFDMRKPVTVTVRVPRPFHTAALLPGRAGIAPTVEGDYVRFTLDAPRHLTLILDGRDAAPLHLFIGEPETDIPSPDDPNVIYYGPGVHEIHALNVRDGQTLYLAGGAVVRAVLPPEEAAGTYSEKWQGITFRGQVVRVRNATDVHIRGRGILDASAIPHPGKTMIFLDRSANVRISGITLRDAANWNFYIGRSRNVTVEDVRIISGRLNSDGINSVSSRDVRVRRCFVRNMDDAIVAKTTFPDQPAEEILVEECVVWSDWGFALGVTYETRAPIRNVAFRRCDLLFVRHWALGIRVCDSATVSDITFADIAVDDPAREPLPPGSAFAALGREPLLLNVAVAQDMWGTDPERGRVRNVLVDGVTLHGDRLFPSSLNGFDAEHDVRHVTLRGIRLLGQPLVADAAGLGLRSNAHVREVFVTPTDR